jgi:hypothetical protein
MRHRSFCTISHSRGPSDCAAVAPTTPWRQRRAPHAAVLLCSRAVHASMCLHAVFCWSKQAFAQEAVGCVLCVSFHRRSFKNDHRVHCVIGDHHGYITEQEPDFCVISARAYTCSWLAPPSPAGARRCMCGHPLPFQTGWLVTEATGVQLTCAMQLRQRKGDGRVPA